MNENATPSDAADQIVAVTEPDEAQTKSSRLPVTALCMAASLTFYVLSAGPMSGLARTIKLRSFNNAVELVYAPLIVIVKKDIRPVSPALRWYAGLFR